jgi:hypothetical protein
MNRVTTTIFSGMIVLSLAGCTVHREFAAQSVPSAAAVGTDKLPLTVAVIADPDLTFDYPRYWKAFVEVLNPGLGQTLQSAFRGNFQNVSVVKAEKSSERCRSVCHAKLASFRSDEANGYLRRTAFR